MSNRYTRITTSGFQPMSMEEIFAVPLAKQGLHDQILSQADQLGLFNINALDADKSTRDEFIGNFTGDLDKLTSEVMQKGVGSLSSTKLRGLITKRNQWMTKGQGKDIAENYGKYTQNKEELDKLYQSGKIGRDVYLLGLQDSVKRYKGVAQGDQYSPFTPVHDTDYEQRAQDIAKAISENPKKITQFSNLTYDPRTGKYMDITTKREYTHAGAIRQAVMETLVNDPEILADLNQRARLGIIGDIGEHISTLGSLNETIYSKDNMDASRKFVGMDHTQLDKAAGTNLQSYEYGADRTVVLNEGELIGKLNKIVEGGNFVEPLVPTAPIGQDEFGVDIYDKEQQGQYNTPATYENLTTKEKSQFDDLYNKLKESGYIPANVAKTDPAAAEGIKGFLEANKDFTYQPIIHTEGLYKNYEGRNNKMKTSTPKDIFAGIRAQKEKRLIIDDDKGKVYSSFDKLPSAYKEALNDPNSGAIVSGVYDSRNLFREKYKGQADRNALTSMYEVMMPDGKKLLFSRSQGEMDSPAYKVDTKYSDLWSDLRYPDLNVPVTLPGIGEIKLRRNRDGSIDRIVDGVPLRLNANRQIAKPGEESFPFFLNDDQLEKTFKMSYGIETD